MADEVKTRRLVVTLPDTSGEEADILVSHLHDVLRNNGINEPVVRHALGETLPFAMTMRRLDSFVFGLDTGYNPRLFNALECRQLAGVLLAAADELEEG